MLCACAWTVLELWGALGPIPTRLVLDVTPWPCTDRLFACDTSRDYATYHPDETT